MRIEQVRPGIFRLLVSGVELAALTSSARWAVEGGKGELTQEAIAQMQQVLASYDDAVKKMHKSNKKPARAGEQ
jgi:hypothetical protein